MVPMRRVEGPECPGCGCPDSEVQKRWTWFEHLYERRRCAHCGREFTVSAGAAPPAASTASPQNGGMINFHVIRCPKCRGERTRVYSVHKPVRYHRCADCGESFKSIEARE